MFLCFPVGIDKEKNCPHFGEKKRFPLIQNPGHTRKHRHPFALFLNIQCRTTDKEMIKNIFSKDYSRHFFNEMNTILKPFVSILIFMPNQCNKQSFIELDREISMENLFASKTILF